MRLLKFRQFVNGEFHYWGYGVMTHPESFVGPATDGTADGVTPSEQYTGLEDKDGIKIYEGDILAYQYDDKDFGNCKVIFKSGQFLVEDSQYSLAGLLSNYTCAIVGNVHENKDLLNG